MAIWKGGKRDNGNDLFYLLHPDNDARDLCIVRHLLVLVYFGNYQKDSDFLFPSDKNMRRREYGSAENYDGALKTLKKLVGVALPHFNPSNNKEQEQTRRGMMPFVASLHIFRKTGYLWRVISDSPYEEIMFDARHLNNKEVHTYASDAKVRKQMIETLNDSASFINDKRCVRI